MSTQLYSSWLATTKPQCHLSHPMPQRVILPPEYQPNLDQRLRELSVDFSLEESILKKTYSSSETGTVESASRNFGPNSLLRPEKLTQVKTNVGNESPSKPQVKLGSEVISNTKTKNMDTVLNQFDTLNIASGSSSDDIRQQLAELFSAPSKATSPHSPSEGVSQTVQQRKDIPAYSQRNFLQGSSGSGPSNDYYSILSPQFPHPNTVSYQKPFPKYYSSSGINSPSDNIRSPNGIAINEAPPLPPPNPLPKPIDLNVTKVNETDPEMDASLNQLVLMGFSQNSALQALQKNNGSLDQAIEALLSGQF